METYNFASVTKKIYQSSFKTSFLKTLRGILAIGNESTFFNVINRLLKNAQIPDLTLANFIYQLSYISFENALNFYGILS